MIFRHPLILTTAIGIGGFLCKCVKDGLNSDFLVNKLQNSFKLNAIVATQRHDFTNVRAIDLILKFRELPNAWLYADTKHELDNFVRNNRVRLPEYNDSRSGWQYQFNPGPLLIAYDDFSIYIRNETDNPSGTFYWTIETITKDNVEHYKHRHMEFLEVDAGHEDKFDVDNIQGISLSVILPTNRNSTPKQYLCKRCKESNLLDVFHQYLKFLTERFEMVHVCSGYLTAPEPGQVLPDPKCVTHTFKIIVCKNANDTFRFECYKIPREYLSDEDIDLKVYIVSRRQLQREAGVTFFPCVLDEEISDVVTHRNFHSNSANVWADKVLHSCLLCHPFQAQPYPDMKYKMY